MITILPGDCLELLPTLADNSIDAIVTDPPYELSFMGKRWDATGIAFRPDVWRECLRVLKPGGYMVAFGGCRTYHRLVCAIEDAGFIIHPMLVWAFGSGFPKAVNASKMIDKLDGRQGAITPNTGKWKGGGGFGAGTMYAAAEGEQTEAIPYTPQTPQAAQWEGWSYGLQSLKPALEPICLAQRPMEGTGAENLLKWGCGAVNIDGCRVPGEVPSVPQPAFNSPTGKIYGFKTGEGRNGEMSGAPLGRWPPNLLLDGSDEVAALFPLSKSSVGGPQKERKGTLTGATFGGSSGGFNLAPENFNGYTDDGSAARFFPALGYSEDERRLAYVPKAGKRDRAGSKHPTVKPVRLIEWLCKLICPPGGVILDPFAGSGTTGVAAANLGFDCVLIEREADYVADIRRRFEIHPSISFT